MCALDKAVNVACIVLRCGCVCASLPTPENSLDLFCINTTLNSTNLNSFFQPERDHIYANHIKEVDLADCSVAGQD